MRKSNLLAIAIFVLAVQLIMLWAVDITTSAMLNNAFVTNGFFIGNPLITYHLALYMLIILSFLQTIIVVHILVRDKDE